MDIDFSQTGQNFALQNSELKVARNPRSNAEDVEESDSKAKQTEQYESVNVSNLQADKSEELSSSSKTIASAVAEISEFVQAQNRHLAFSIDESSQRAVVKVTDAESGDVIRQIPSEEVLLLSERIKELQSDVGAAVGILFNKQV
jgi:flagellar protein FlaG